MCRAHLPGFAWICRKSLLLVALVFSVAALLLLGFAPLGWRAGWWPYRFALAGLMPASAVVAALAVTLSLLTLVLRWSELDLRGVAMVSVALVLGAALAYVPWQYNRMRTTLPAIHDITTDTENPPNVQCGAPGTGSRTCRRRRLPRPARPAASKTAYPDVAPLKAPMPVGKAFAEALDVARSMPGWTIVASEPDAGRIEASQQSRWFRFTDDIVIRVACDELGAHIDMRSTSRQGRSDFGVNAARIRAYLVALRQRIG